jgi:hypothetical protein
MDKKVEKEVVQSHERSEKSQWPRLTVGGPVGSPGALGAQAQWEAQA